MKWNSINIKQGQAIIAAQNLPDRIDSEIAILVALYGKSVDYYESLPRHILIRKIAKTGWIETLPAPKFQAPFRSGNNLYKFKSHPNQMSKSDFVLLQKYGATMVDDLHRILAVLSIKFQIIPPRLSHNVNDFEARAELFLNKMPFGLAYSYALFFSTYYPHLLQIGQSFLQGQQRAAKEFLSQNDKTPS